MKKLWLLLAISVPLQSIYAQEGVRAPTPTFYLYFLLVVIASCIVVFGSAIAFLVFEAGNDIREGVAYLKEIEKTLTQINNKLTLIQDDMRYLFAIDDKLEQIIAEHKTEKDHTTNDPDVTGRE